MLSITELLLILSLVSLVTIISVRFTQDNMQPVQPIIQIQTPAHQGGGDNRYTRAPRPQRMWQAEPEIPIVGLVDPIPTRGAPESYQQMGVMVGADGKPLPLYGRRTAPRSDKFNYYTRTDSYNPVALPVTFKNKDCQDNAGCSEVSSGDSIRISPTGETAKVTLYGFDGPRYSPDI
jgi:hypothetical protein